MNLEFIDTIPTDVLEEMLEDISLDYSSRDYFYESLDDFLSYEILNEERKDPSAERKKRIQAAVNKNATAEKRRRDKFQRKQTTAKINQGLKGKYDRRPWYQKAFNKLKKWASKGIESLNKKKGDDNADVVYVTAPASTRSRSVTTSNRATPATPTQQRPNNQQQPEPPKPKTETQIRAGKLRAERKATENKKKITYNKFKERAQQSKFKKVPKPSPASILNRTVRTTVAQSSTPSTEPRHPDAAGNAAPPTTVRASHPASPEAIRGRRRTAPRPPSSTSMRP